jgi:Ala-tRNA(Pro) deacylase
MSVTREALFDRLTELGIRTRTVDHRPLFTVAESKALRGEISGMHTKNLFLKDKRGALWLVVAREDRPIDLKELRVRLGAAPWSFAKPDVLRAVLGVDPGSVTPFGLINDVGCRVAVVLDETMMDEPSVNVHPLINTATTQISPRDLLAFIRACGHNPRIVPL